MVEEVRKIVEKAWLKHVETVCKGDAAAMAAFFTEDAILLPHSGRVLRGFIDVCCY